MYIYILKKKIFTIINNKSQREEQIGIINSIYLLSFSFYIHLSIYLSIYLSNLLSLILHILIYIVEQNIILYIFFKSTVVCYVVQIGEI